MPDPSTTGSSQYQDGLKFELTLTPGQTGANWTIQGIEGHEEISRPYLWKLYLTSDKAFDLSQLIGSKASVKVSLATGAVNVHGLVLSVRGYDPPPSDGARALHSYCLEIHPRLSVLGHHQQNRIFGPDAAVKTKDIIEKVLKGAEQAERGTAVTIDSDLNFIYGKDYQARNFVVQYEESDYAFLLRQCEAAGVFFFFKHDDSKETIFFGDDNNAFSDVQSDYLQDKTLPYGASTGAAMLTFGFIASSTPSKVNIRDYNPARPSQTPMGQASITNGLLGIVHHFGGLVGAALNESGLARVRAEEYAARHVVYRGKSNLAALRPGMVFEMSGHPNTAFNQKYLVISMDHSAAGPAPAGYQSPIAAKSYTNTFSCIPYDVPFRPARVTPIPFVAGVHTATVDGPDGLNWDKRAQIDADGRYKVTFVNTIANSNPPPAGSTHDKGSDYVRKASPYSGAGDTGMEFPLLPGTEVLIAYLNGDIDYPVILGAIPNADTASVVKQANQQYNRLRTQAGMVIEMFDGPYVPPPTTTTP